MASNLQKAIAGQVRAVFHRPGEAPVHRSAESWFGPQSVCWRVHGDVTTMMVGGVSALLLQMLHPAVLAGVWDHSNFRTDMQGRLRRTARFIAQTTYASRSEAEAAIAQVRQVHARVSGLLPDGTPYVADDPRLLEWVHVTEATSFLDAWLRYAEPAMAQADRDRYFAEFARVPLALGAERVPTSEAEARAAIEAMRPALKVDARTREVARLLLGQKPGSIALLAPQQITFAAAVDLLPGWARAMHGLASPVLARPLVRAGTLGLRGTLRWALGA